MLSLASDGMLLRLQSLENKPLSANFLTSARRLGVPAKNVIEFDLFVFQGRQSINEEANEFQLQLVVDQRLFETEPRSK